MGLTLKAGSSAKPPEGVEEGIADLKFIGVEAKTLPNSKFDPEAFIWSFELLDEDGDTLYSEGEPVVIDKITGQSVNTKSKTTPGAVKVLKALMTAKEFAAFEAEEPVDADSLIGRIVQGNVFIKENGWPGIDGDLLPARKKKAS